MKCRSIGSSSLWSLAFELTDYDIQVTFCRCIGVDMSDAAWQQAQISLSEEALGLGHCPTTQRQHEMNVLLSLCSSGQALERTLTAWSHSMHDVVRYAHKAIVPQVSGSVSWECFIMV